MSNGDKALDGVVDTLLQTLLERRSLRRELLELPTMLLVGRAEVVELWGVLSV